MVDLAVKPICRSSNFWVAKNRLDAFNYTKYGGYPVKCNYEYLDKLNKQLLGKTFWFRKKTTIQLVKVALKRALSRFKMENKGIKKAVKDNKKYKLDQFMYWLGIRKCNPANSFVPTSILRRVIRNYIGFPHAIIYNIIIHTKTLLGFKQ